MITITGKRMLTTALLTCFILAACQSADMRDRTQDSLAHITTQKRDSVTDKYNLISVVDLPRSVPVTGFDRHSADEHFSQGKRFLIADHEIYSLVYGHMSIDSNMDELKVRVRNDSASLTSKYESSLFVGKGLGNIHSDRNTFYAVVFYNEDGGVVYSVDEQGDTVRVDSLDDGTAHLINRLSEVHPKSSIETSSGSQAPAIVAMLTKGKPQVFISQHAFPYHTRPEALISSKLSKDEVEERKLVDSTIQSIMNRTGLQNAW